ncbi:hypothetical protein FQN54_000160 [Arachnomyces sp. PD_36]|nr:hypothetical protein FQN54_000160 [Arachnomyces sp. PD_36]
MRFLCLHGKGTSGDILKTQTCSFRPKLRSDIDFDFVDGPVTGIPSPDVKLFFEPPYYAFWDEKVTLEGIRASHKWLLELLEKKGPYDGVLMFSQGCGFITSFLLYHRRERPDQPLPFKTGVFICGSLPLRVLEDLEFPVPQAAYDIEDVTKRELQEKAASLNTMELGGDRWAQPGGGTKNDARSSFDPSKPIDPQNVFGLDFTRMPPDLGIDMPTVHIYGIKDPRYPGAIQLSQFYNSDLRKTYDHQGGHEIPRQNEVSQRIADLVEWAVSMAQSR